MVYRPNAVHRGPGPWARRGGGEEESVDPMNLSFLPDDYGLTDGDGSMLNGEDYNYEAGIFDGSKMGPSTAKICPWLTLGSTDREIRHRDSAGDYLQWYLTSSVGNIGYFWKGDGDHTKYKETGVASPTAEWVLTIEHYRLLVTNGHGVEFFFWGNDDLTYMYDMIVNPYSNYTRLLKRTPGQDYYWTGSAWSTSVTNLGTAAMYSSWETTTITFRPGVSFDIANTRGTASDTNITEDIGGSCGPVLGIVTYLAGRTGEMLWTRDITRAYSMT